MGFQSSLQTTHKLLLCKQPSNWPFVSTTAQSSHLAMSIKKPLNVTRTMSRKCCSWKQIFRISYQGQTQLDAVYSHRRMFCYHPYIFLFRLLSWIYFLQFRSLKNASLLQAVNAYPSILLPLVSNTRLECSISFVW